MPHDVALEFDLWKHNLVRGMPGAVGAGSAAPAITPTGLLVLVRVPVLVLVLGWVL